MVGLVIVPVQDSCCTTCPSWNSVGEILAGIENELLPWQFPGASLGGNRAVGNVFGLPELSSVLQSSAYHPTLS